MTVLVLISFWALCGKTVYCIYQRERAKILLITLRSICLQAYARSRWLERRRAFYCAEQASSNQSRYWYSGLRYPMVLYDDLRQNARRPGGNYQALKRATVVSCQNLQGDSVVV